MNQKESRIENIRRMAANDSLAGTKHVSDLRFLLGLLDAANDEVKRFGVAVAEWDGYNGDAVVARLVPTPRPAAPVVAAGALLPVNLSSNAVSQPSGPQGAQSNGQRALFGGEA